MARMEVKQVTQRAQTAWSKKDNWRSLLQDGYELALPMRNPYFGSGDGVHRSQEGQRKMDRVFDSTLMNANVRLANRLQSEMTPPFMKWAELAPGPFIPEDKKQEARQALKPITDTVFAALQLSDFDTQVNEFYLELGMGTAVMMILEGPDNDPIKIQTIPTAQVALEPGPFGSIGGVFRRHEIEIHLIEQSFKQFKFKKPEGWDKRITDNPNDTVILEEATYFNDKDDTWYYDVIMRKVGDTAKKTGGERIIEDQFEESPYLVTRWVKVAGEVQGRGPVLFALPDAKTLNKLKELVLRNASIAVSGVWTAVNDGVLNPNNVAITPGTVIPVARNGGPLGASLMPLQFAGNFDVSAFLAEDLINSIKGIMMDDRLPEEAGPVRSATEFIMRQKQLQADIGAPFGRLMSEFIRPLFKKIVSILRRKGIPAFEGIFVDGAQVDVSVSSPLAQGQNLTELETAVQWMQLNQAMGPETFLLGVKVEDFAEWSALKMNVDPALVRDEDDRRNMGQMGGQLLAQSQNAGPVAANANAGPVQVAA